MITLNDSTPHGFYRGYSFRLTKQTRRIQVWRGEYLTEVDTISEAEQVVDDWLNAK